MEILWYDYERRRLKFNEELQGRGEEIKEKSTLEEICAWEDYAARNFRFGIDNPTVPSSPKSLSMAAPSLRERADLV